jgi:catalase
MPRAIERAPRPEVTRSPALSLLARPGQGGIRSRVVALLVAEGVDARSLLAVRAALQAQGAVARLLGSRIGPVRAASGQILDADASMENEPAVVFDALVLPDGEEAVEQLGLDGRTGEFIKEQYRHCKPILAIGAAAALLDGAGVFRTLDEERADPGIVVVSRDEVDAGTTRFIEALARHRTFERDRDPPRV